MRANCWARKSIQLKPNGQLEHWRRRNTPTQPILIIYFIAGILTFVGLTKTNPGRPTCRLVLYNHRGGETTASLSLSSRRVFRAKSKWGFFCSLAKVRNFCNFLVFYSFAGLTSYEFCFFLPSVLTLSVSIRFIDF